MTKKTSADPKPRQTALTPITPMDMIQMAVQGGADLDKLEKLMDLQERWEKDKANKAFIAAMAGFKKNPPVITKDKHVKYKNKDGTLTEYDHPTHEQVCSVISAALIEHDIYHDWKTEQSKDGTIRVICVLTHKEGHKEFNSLECGPDKTGGKNNIQAIASADTYLQRYTLMASVGLSSAEQDMDGRDPVEYITEKQAAELSKMNEKKGNTPEQFLKYLKVDALDELPKSRFNEAKQAVQA